MSLNVDQAFGSQEVQKYYFPNFTRDKATACKNFLLEFNMF